METQGDTLRHIEMSWTQGDIWRHIRTHGDTWGHMEKHGHMYGIHSPGCCLGQTSQLTESDSSSGADADMLTMSRY